MQAAPRRKGQSTKNRKWDLAKVERHQTKAAGLENQVQRLHRTLHLNTQLARLARQADPVGAGRAPTNPEHPRQIHAMGRRRGWVEHVERIDKRNQLALRSGLRQPGHQESLTPRRTWANDLRDLAARQSGPPLMRLHGGETRSQGVIELAGTEQ
jgi:hypothetical protein